MARRLKAATTAARAKAIWKAVRSGRISATGAPCLPLSQAKTATIKVMPTREPRFLRTALVLAASPMKADFTPRRISLRLGA